MDNIQFGFECVWQFWDVFNQIKKIDYLNIKIIKISTDMLKLTIIRVSAKNQGFMYADAMFEVLQSLVIIFNCVQL